MQIGAQLLGGAEARDVADPGQPEPGFMGPRPKADGTLLAVVPIPGTGTSMAIVGYPVTAPGGVARRRPGRSRRGGAASAALRAAA